MATYDFPHQGRAQTARWMYFLSENYADDLGELARLPLLDFHEMVSRMPYASDDLAWGDPFREVVARPGYILQMLKNQQVRGVDCKKKAILLGAWATRNGVPWELVAMSERPDKEIHHVFPLLRIGRQWVNADATYARHAFGAAKPEMTHAERLAR